MKPNQEARRYLTRVRRQLVCSAPARRRLLSRAKEMAEQFGAENPCAQYEDYVSAFGSPEEFAGIMLSTLDRSEVERAGLRRCLRLRFALVGLILILFAAGGVGWSLWAGARETPGEGWAVVLPYSETGGVQIGRIP